MPVRKTESRIPQGLQASDLGEAVVAADGRCALVSFLSSPLVTDHENVYVLFVTDPTLAATAQSFEWTTSEIEGAYDSTNTDYGEFVYAPQGNGRLYITVRVLDASGDEQASISIDQDIFSPNDDIENLIAQADDAVGPGVGDPDSARELVNDLNPYYQGVTLQSPETGDGFQSVVFGIVSDGTTQQTPDDRKQALDQVAAALNDGVEDYATLVSDGMGVCAIRMVLLAMNVPQSSGSTTAFLPWTELPQDGSERSFAEQQLRDSLAALDEAVRIDLFNLVRFPKSCITQCGRIIEALRDRYFNGANFDDVITGMSGTRAVWITKHYRQGPLITS